MEPEGYVSFLKKQPGFYTLGLLVYRYRKWAIALWSIFIALSLLAVPQLNASLKEIGSIYEAGSAHQADVFLQQDFNIGGDALVVVFQRLPGHAVDPTQPQLAQILTKIAALPAVSAVAGPMAHPEYRSADGTAQYSVINLAVKDLTAIVAAIDQIEQILSRYTLPGWKSFLTGVPVVNRDVQTITKADLGRIEFLVLPLTLGALLLVFGSVAAAILPIVMAIVAVSVTLGLLNLIALNFNVSVFALNLISMLGLGLGIDYALLMVNRFREELGSGSIEAAIARTVETAGRAVFFSGLTVCIGLVGLLLFPITLLQSLGMAGALVVLLSVLVALTLLPALLGFVGRRVQRQIFSIQSGTQRQDYWTAIAQQVIRHTIPAVVSVLVIVVGLSAPFLQARFGLASADILPRNFSARTGAEILEQSFGPGEISPILLLVRTASPLDSILSEPHITTLYQTVKQLTGDPRVASVSSLFSINPTLSLAAYQHIYQDPHPADPSQLTAMVKSSDGHSLLLFRSQSVTNAAMRQEPGIPALKLDSVQTWFTTRSSTILVIKSRTARNHSATRTLVKDLQMLKLNGLQVWVAGQTARELDTIQIVYQRFPVVLMVMMGVTLVILYLLLDSVILPLKAIVMNMLSIGASFGALVFIFQEGHFQRWLGFTPVGYLDLLLPIVLFCVLFGLSMDYEVFMLTRIKESHDAGKSNTESVIDGLRLTGGIITSAALLMIIVTSTFVLSRIIFVKALGLGCSIAVLVDVTLIRAILVPATMNLLGKWNWWSLR